MRSLMLVSADAGPATRTAILEGRRPEPEFITLEREFGVRLLDWSRAGITPGRSTRRSARHVGAALSAAAAADAVFSDGEHIGIPMGIAMCTLGPARPHLVLGHHLTTRSKPRLLRWLRHMGITRVLVHSTTQLRIAQESLGFRAGSVAFEPYYADARFWRPENDVANDLIVSAGREHRDYTTLAAAVADLPVQTFIAAGSLYSPEAACLAPDTLPSNVTVGMRTPLELRELYEHAAVVVVPLIPNDFQAGVTTLLEAMAMGRPVIVTATEGQRDIVVDGETAVFVPPGDAVALRNALGKLLGDPSERRRLGGNAREAVLAKYNLPQYAARLHRHLVDICRPASRAA
jgi:glycosyltransferase involved in cell wall biosynthesis